MEYKTFEHIILKLQLIQKRDESIYHLGLDLTNITDDYSQVITALLRAHYGEIGEDIISWWLYEDVDKFLYKENKIVNDLTLMEDLWKYCEKLRKSKSFIPYIIPEPKTIEERKQIIEQFFKK